MSSESNVKGICHWFGVPLESALLSALTWDRDV
jgi:hypothetical protein